MKKKTPLTEEESQLFREAISGVKALEQDKIPFDVARSKQKTAFNQKNSEENRLRQQAAAAFEFSDGFEAHFPEQGPIKWARTKEHNPEVKRLRQGVYPPELTLDLHGFNRQDAKLEIAALIQRAEKRHIFCVCIVHGIGSRVLKKAIPSWLVQHPCVIGFHNAPLEYGGNGALLVLLDCIPEYLR